MELLITEVVISAQINMRLHKEVKQPEFYDTCLA